MEINELRKLSTDELNKRIKETKANLFTKRMQAANGTLEKPVELRNLRREVARMKTILNERKMGGNENE